MPELTLTEPEFSLKEGFPRLSRDDLDLTIQYYATVYKLYKTEAALLYHYEDAEDRYYVLSPPWYAANGGHVEYAGLFRTFCPSCQILQTQVLDRCPVCGGEDMREFQYMGQSHSHGAGGAFTSSDDDANEEVISGFKFTVGKVDKLAAEIYPSFVIAVDGYVDKNRRGKRFLTRLDELVDMGFPEGLQQRVRFWMLNVAAPEKAKMMRHIYVVDHPTFGGSMDAIQFMSPEKEKAEEYCNLTKQSADLVMSATQWVDALTKRKKAKAAKATSRYVPKSTIGSTWSGSTTSQPLGSGRKPKVSGPSTPVNAKKPTAGGSKETNLFDNPWADTSQARYSLNSWPRFTDSRSRLLVGALDASTVYCDRDYGFNSDTSVLDSLLDLMADENESTENMAEVLIKLAATCTWLIGNLSDDDEDSNDIADCLIDCDSAIETFAKPLNIDVYEPCEYLATILVDTATTWEANTPEHQMLAYLVVLSECLCHLGASLDKGDEGKPGTELFATAVSNSVISNSLPAINKLSGDSLFDIAPIVERIFSEGFQCAPSRSSGAGAQATT